MSGNNSKTSKIGERFTTNEGYEIIIIDYINANNVWIEFQDKYKNKKKVYYSQCKLGTIKNEYHPSVQGVGFIGVGKYKTKEHGKMTKCYMTWINVLTRTHDEEFKNKRSTYIDARIDESWYNYQVFAEWYYNNYYEIEGETMCLDKDILYKGNKEYAPDKCIFVPNRINVLFIKSDIMRGDFPIGVSYDKRGRKYMAQCQTIDNENNRHNKFLGYYNVPHEAFLAYKEFKEAYIKQVADEYKDKIPQRLYDAMYAWTVEEDD